MKETNNLIKILKCRKDAEERRDNEEDLYDCRYCRDCDKIFDKMIEFILEAEELEKELSVYKALCGGTK